MPTLQAYQDSLIRSDYGLLLLAGLVALCCAITIVLWRRWPRFASAGRLVGPWLIPLATLPVNPPAALLAAVLAGLTRLKISLPRGHIEPEWILVLAGLLTRLPTMNDSLWYDESFTARIAGLRFDQLPAAIMADVHPPGHYLLIWLYAQLVGLHDALLRLPELALGLLAIVLFHRLALAAGLSRRAAFAAALLMCFLPAGVYYGVELRPYALLSCVFFGALLALLKDRPIWFALLTGSMVWFHDMGLLYLAVFAAVGVLYYRRRAWWLAGIGGCLIALPWLPFMAVQASHVADGYWLWMDAGRPIWLFLLGILTVPESYIVALVIPALALVILTFWVGRHWAATRPGMIVLLIAFGIPALGAAVSFLWHPIFVPRAFLPCALLFLLPWGIALTDGREWRLARTITVPFLALALAVFYSPYNARPPYRAAVAEGCKGATAMFYTSIASSFIAAHYWTGPALLWPGSIDVGDTFGLKDMPDYGFTIGTLDQFAGQRVCLFLLDSPLADPGERAYIASLIAEYPHTHVEVDVNRVQHLYFYVVDL